MAGIFKFLLGSGDKKGAKAPTPQESIQQMRNVEELLTKKQDFLEQKIKDCTVNIKKQVNTNKRCILTILIMNYLIVYHILHSASTALLIRKEMWKHKETDAVGVCPTLAN